MSKTTKLQCSSCGADATASCECGVAYLPAGKRAEEAVAANPEKSDRAIAAEIGVDHKTVAKARARTGDNSPVEKRTGKDGKQRKLPEPKPKSPDSPVHTPLSERELRRMLKVRPALGPASDVMFATRSLASCLNYEGYEEIEEGNRFTPSLFWEYLSLRGEDHVEYEEMLHESLNALKAILAAIPNKKAQESHQPALVGKG